MGFGWGHELDLTIEVIHADAGAIPADREQSLEVLPGHAAKHDVLVLLRRSNGMASTIDPESNIRRRTRASASHNLLISQFDAEATEEPRSIAERHFAANRRLVAQCHVQSYSDSVVSAEEEVVEKPKVVSDIMTREVATVFEEDNLLGVEQGMQRFRFRHLPVVDGNKLVGIITHRDLLRIAASTLETASEQKTNYWNESCFARDIMTRNPITVGRDTPLAVAGKLMWDGKLGCLPVIEADGTLVGIVTEADFLRLAIDLLE